MEYTELGRTGLRVSVAGLGCGGSSRLGRTAGKSMAESVAVVRRALELGVTFFDTAEAYGTEEILGEALRGVPRDSVAIATKTLARRGGALRAPGDALASLDASLRRLGTDHVDLFMVHAVAPGDYEAVRDRLLPALRGARDAGKARHIGLSETPPNDPRHDMLERALADDRWDAAMLAFHMMSQNARTRVFPVTRAQRVGTLVMFAVRAIFSDPAYLARTMAALAAEGRIPPEPAEGAPLDFLIRSGGARSVIDAAYRYARHEPGADVVLFGTGDAAHVEANVASILRPPLPAADRAELARRYGALEGVGLDLPRTGARAQAAAKRSGSDTP